MNKYQVNIIGQRQIIFCGLWLLLSCSAYAETYTYDNTGRLTGVTYADGSQLNYSYDANGNRLSRTTVLNTPAVANDDSATTAFETAVNIDILANDTDSDGSINAATVAIGTDVSNGATMVDNTTGVVTYTPNTAFSGDDSFTYTVQDNSGAISNLAKVSITVKSKVSTGSSSGGGSLGLASGLWLLMLGLSKKFWRIRQRR